MGQVWYPMPGSQLVMRTGSGRRLAEAPPRVETDVFLWS